MERRRRADAGKCLGREEFEEKEIDALGEVRDVARTKCHADVTAGVVEPEDVFCWEASLVEMEVPTVTED